MSVFEKMRKQPEFNEQLWQYINRRVSDWRLAAGKAALQKYNALFTRIEKDFGVEPRNAAGAVGRRDRLRRSAGAAEPHAPGVSFARRTGLERTAPQGPIGETELINALRIVDKHWSTPEEMRGSWAGAMGHTQWMPEVWLNVGFDYDGDGPRLAIRQAG